MLLETDCVDTDVSAQKKLLISESYKAVADPDADDTVCSTKLFIQAATLKNYTEGFQNQHYPSNCQVFCELQ